MSINFDSSFVLFLNKIVGRSPALDQAVELVSDTSIFGGILFVALLWLIWFKDKREESRTRLIMGGVAAALPGLMSRLLQLALPYHERPLYAEPSLRWPIGIEWGTLSHWNSFPSDHAALFFGLATVVWLNDRRLGVFAFFWAAITSFTRIYLGFHYPSDILGGAVLGILVVILLLRLPVPAVAYRLIDWERNAPSSFYAVAFIASYQVGTTFHDVRAIGSFVARFLLRYA
jgi:undecaprenyl-diphosphatase